MTTQADLIAAALRPIAPRGKLAPDDVGLINALGQRWEDRLMVDLGPAAKSLPDPAWVVIGRKLIGVTEVPGPRHNPTILKFWTWAPWIKTDEDPWCGGFIGWCMKEAGIDIPKSYPSAASWATWGIACPPQLGAIGVKKRTGGNHVFMIVGETPDKRSFKSLGGNQSNGVNISDIHKSDVYAVRWPTISRQLVIPLPVMAPGRIGAEA